jgi:hypothetical protein
VVIRAEKSVLDTIHQHLLTVYSSQRTGQKGLGQIIKECKISDFQGTSFCSKWFFIENGNLRITRDYTKLLS